MIIFNVSNSHFNFSVSICNSNKSTCIIKILAIEPVFLALLNSFFNSSDDGVGIGNAIGDDSSPTVIVTSTRNTIITEHFT